MKSQPLAIVTVAAVAASVAGMLTFPQVRAQAQAPAASAPVFEAASIKPNKSNDGRIGIGFQPGGRFTATNVTLRMLVGIAYGTPQPRPESQIVGGPDWINSERFDVVAKAEGDPQPGPQGPPPAMFLMIRTLLAERFKLVAHDENRELPMFALMLAKSDGKLGAQLRPSAVDCAAMMRGRGPGRGFPPPPAPGERIPCGIRIGPGSVTAGSVSMAQLATLLTRFANRVVLDRTGLTGNYDVDLTWTPDQMPNFPGGGPPPGAPPLPPIDPNGPSLFTAVQEQLGLKLDSQRGPVEVIVIDSVEHLTDN